MIIDVFQDTICPWCRVGKRNLQKALEQVDEEVEVHYRSFFLYYNTPKEGMSLKEYMNLKGIEEKEKFLVPIRVIAQNAGFDFDLYEHKKVPNTILSHQLTKIVPEELQQQLLDKIHFGYFDNDDDIGDIDVLCRYAKELGLDDQDIRNRLLNEEGKDIVMGEYKSGLLLGVRGVPFFVINQKVGVNGAQSPQKLLAAIKFAQEKESQSATQNS